MLTRDSLSSQVPPGRVHGTVPLNVAQCAPHVAAGLDATAHTQLQDGLQIFTNMRGREVSVDEWGQCGAWRAVRVGHAHSVASRDPFSPAPATRLGI